LTSRYLPACMLSLYTFELDCTFHFPCSVWLFFIGVIPFYFFA
jgi:hypothetical protein